MPCKVEGACAFSGIASHHAVLAVKPYLYESVLQLRGSPANQVHDAAIGLTHNLGDFGVACTVNILRRPDAR